MYNQNFTKINSFICYSGECSDTHTHAYAKCLLSTFLELRGFQNRYFAKFCKSFFMITILPPSIKYVEKRKMVRWLMLYCTENALIRALKDYVTKYYFIIRPINASILKYWKISCLLILLLCRILGILCS